MRAYGNDNGAAKTAEIRPPSPLGRLILSLTAPCLLRMAAPAQRLKVIGIPKQIEIVPMGHDVIRLCCRVATCHALPISIEILPCYSSPRC